MLTPVNSAYFGGNCYAYGYPGGVYSLNLKINVSQGVSAGNNADAFTGLPFTWNFDFFFPAVLTDGTTIVLRGNAGEHSIRLGEQHGTLPANIIIYANVTIAPQFTQ